MINISAIAEASNVAISLNKLILVKPQNSHPMRVQKNDGTLGEIFLFHYEESHEVTIDTDITDHYVEDNSFRNDQIALKPDMVLARGFIAELNNAPPLGLVPVKMAAEKLTLISEYTPSLSETAIEAYNTAFQAYQAAESIENSIASWDSINGDTLVAGADVDLDKIQSNQQRAFQKLYAYSQKRVLFTVQTPWAIFTDMAIMNFKSLQDMDTTKDSTDFEVRFKKIRFATSVFESDSITDSRIFLNRSKNQNDPLVDMGTQIPRVVVDAPFVNIA